MTSCVDPTPAGAIVAFPGACPTGWTAYTPAAGRFLVGAGTSVDAAGNGASYVSGQTGGENKHRLTIAEMPVHSLTMTEGDPQNWTGTGYVGGYSFPNPAGLPHNMSTDPIGGDQPHSIVPSYVAVTWCQKT